MTLRDKYMKEKLYEQQGGRCNAPCENYELRRGIRLPIRLFENDHIDPEGGDEIENRQLLCSHCNRVKKDRPMVSLLDHHRAKYSQCELPGLLLCDIHSLVTILHNPSTKNSAGTANPSSPSRLPQP